MNYVEQAKQLSKRFFEFIDLKFPTPDEAAAYFGVSLLDMSLMRKDGIYSLGIYQLAKLQALGCNFNWLIYQEPTNWLKQRVEEHPAETGMRIALNESLTHAPSRRINEVGQDY